MANQHYAEFPERKSVAGGGGPPPTGPKAGKEGSVKMGTASWGLRGAPTQVRNRHLGVREVHQYAKAEGLTNYDPVFPNYDHDLNFATTGKLFGGQLGPAPFRTPLTVDLAPAVAPYFATRPQTTLGGAAMAISNKRKYGTVLPPPKPPAPEGSVDPPYVGPW